MPAVYHITHVENLLGIIAAGGLWCDAVVVAKRLAAVGIAHDHIKKRRASREVPTGHGGMLADYVPFYFSPLSPMLFAIHKGQVQGYAGGQVEVIYLVSSTEAVAAELPCVFTDGHAEMAYASFFSDPSGAAGAIDWQLMKERYWANTPEDPNRKFRRQAEFLVHSFFPWSLVQGIGVANAGMASRVIALVGGNGPNIAIQRSWYY